MSYVEISDALVVSMTGQDLEFLARPSDVVKDELLRLVSNVRNPASYSDNLLFEHFLRLEWFEPGIELVDL